MLVLKKLREHYYTPDGGMTWFPKRAFDNREQIEKEIGFKLSISRDYTCRICNKLHLASRNK